MSFLKTDCALNPCCRSISPCAAEMPCGALCGESDVLGLSCKAGALRFGMTKKCSFLADHPGLH